MPSGINLSAITPYSTGIINLINQILVPVLMAIAFIVFLWGVYTYFIQGAADPSERETGRQFVLWGIIGFVVIVSLWGLVNLTMSVLGLSVGNAPTPPTFGALQTYGGVNAANFPGASQVGGGGGGTSGGVGSNVFSSNGSALGRVNSNNQIVNSAGQIIGAMRNGQAVDLRGVAIPGATTGRAVAQNVTTCDTDNFTPAECHANCSGTWNSTDETCTSGSGSVSSANNNDAAYCTDPDTGDVTRCSPASASGGACTPSCNTNAAQECRNGGCYANTALSSCLDSCPGQCSVDSGTVSCSTNASSSGGTSGTQGGSQSPDYCYDPDTGDNIACP